MGIELEQKYVVDSQRPWQVQAELLSLLNRAGYEVRLLGETPQEDVYYDTPEDDFLLTGGSLRVRRRGERRVLTLKTPVGQTPQTGAFARREEELELSSDALPADFLRERLPELDPDALRPAAQVENLRRTYEVKGPVGCRFELAFDDVIFRDAGTGETARERQVEIERLEGTEADLARLVRETAGRVTALRGVTDSKYQRARKLAGPEGRRGQDKRTPPG